MRATAWLVLFLVSCSGGDVSRAPDDDDNDGAPDDVDASISDPIMGGNPASSAKDAAGGSAGANAARGDAGAADALTSSDATPVPVPSQVAIIDSHTHFWSEAPAWAAPGSYLARSFSFDNFTTVATPLGIAGVVWVTTDGADRNAALLAQAARDPLVKAFVGSLSFSSDSFDAQLKEATKHSLFRGIRVGASDLSDALTGPKAQIMQTHITQFAQAGFTLDVIAQNPRPRDFDAIDAFAARYSQLKIVYNHLGEPDLPVPSDAWFAAIKNIGMRKNVYIKLSGLAEHLEDADAALQNVSTCCDRALDAVFEAFGDDRVLFSSNWPVSAARADLSLVVKAIESYVSQQQRAGLKLKVFRTNTLRAYGIQGS